jgi:hypothetical protein
MLASPDPIQAASAQPSEPRAHLRPPPNGTRSAVADETNPRAGRERKRTPARPPTASTPVRWPAVEQPE